ncbi:MAG: hypothetical protein JJV93_01685 [Alphaproteobacteria bacterium]|nr:hypothetical protein [Alphaproteobacteria bacterium]MBL0717958.1 hypothetical protein [Alphaproteobacteria bacterium]
MAFTKAMTDKMSRLSQLELTEAVASNLKLDSILEWVGELKVCDTEGIDPMFSTAPFNMKMREDKKISTPTREEIFFNTSNVDGDKKFFSIPKVIETK